MGKKIIACFILVVAFSLPVCLAAETKEDTDYVALSNARVYAKDLQASRENVYYEGYWRLSGYPGEAKYTVYFQDTSKDEDISAHIILENNSGINMMEDFFFTYNGIDFHITRDEAYHIFSVYPSSDLGNFLKDTFPGAYKDWSEEQDFSEKAKQMVYAYLRYQQKTLAETASAAKQPAS